MSDTGKPTINQLDYVAGAEKVNENGTQFVHNKSSKIKFGFDTNPFGKDILSIKMREFV